MGLSCIGPALGGTAYTSTRIRLVRCGLRQDWFASTDGWWGYTGAPASPARCRADSARILVPRAPRIGSIVLC